MSLPAAPSCGWLGEREVLRADSVPRRALVEALVLLGPRVSELCRWDVGHLDLANDRAHLPLVKTEASARIVPMLPAMRERLIADRLDYPGRDRACLPDPHRTASAPGERALAHPGADPRQANELLEAEGRLPIAHLTPHTLRRTFALIVAICNVPPRRAMYLLGHTPTRRSRSPSTSRC